MRLSYHYMLMANHVILQKKLFLSLKDTGLTLGQPKVLDFLQEKRRGSPERDCRSLSYRAGFAYHYPQWHGRKGSDPEKKPERESALLAYFSDRQGKRDDRSHRHGI